MASESDQLGVKVEANVKQIQEIWEFYAKSVATLSRFALCKFQLAVSVLVEHLRKGQLQQETAKAVQGSIERAKQFVHDIDMTVPDPGQCNHCPFLNLFAVSSYWL